MSPLHHHYAAVHHNLTLGAATPPAVFTKQDMGCSTTLANPAINRCRRDGSAGQWGMLTHQPDYKLYYKQTLGALCRYLHLPWVMPVHMPVCIACQSLDDTQEVIYKSLWAPASCSRTQANEVGVLGNCLGHRDGLGIMHTPMPERKGSFQYYSSSVIQFFRTLSWCTPMQSLGSLPYTGCKLRSSPPLAQAYPISRNSPHICRYSRPTHVAGSQKPPQTQGTPALAAPTPAATPAQMAEYWQGGWCGLSYGRGGVRASW